MQKTITTLEELKLVGITTRANNAKLFESDPSTNIIAATVQKYFHNGLAQKISNRKNPGTTFCVYTGYKNGIHYNDHTDEDYVYFIGEAVTHFDENDKEFETLTVPAQTYAKFTNSPGPMPAVCVDMWKNIWEMSNSDLGGARAYIASGRGVGGEGVSAPSLPSPARGRGVGGEGVSVYPIPTRDTH